MIKKENRRMKIMFKGILEDDSIWIKGIMMVFVCLIFTVFFTLSAGIISLFEVKNDFTILKITQLFSSVGLFIVSSFVLAYFFSKNPLAFLSFRSVRFGAIVLAVISVWAIVPFSNFIEHHLSFPESLKKLEDILRNNDERLNEMSRQLVHAESIGGLLFNLFVVALVPAIGEELLFRGIVQNSLQKSFRNPHVAIWITAFIFSLVHFQLYGFFQRFLLGAYFGYLLFWSRSIWLPILAHFVNNATIVIVAFFTEKGNVQFDIEKFGADGNPIPPVCSVILFSLSVVCIWRLTCRKT